MDRQPYIYTLPEQFINDSAVPLHWKLYTIINGFWISGKPVFASNAFFAEKLKCSERHIRSCLEKLEEMNLLERTGKSQNRTIVPKGGSGSSYQDGTDSSVRAEPAVPHISDSNAVQLTGAKMHKTFTVTDENPKEKKVTPEMQKVFDLFSFNPARLVWKGRVHQREAAKVLFDTFGSYELKQRLAVSQKYRNEPLCPQVDNPADFLEKMPKLETFLKNL